MSQICLSFFPIILENMNELALPNDASKDQIRSILIKAIEVCKAEYMKFKMTESVLTKCVGLFEEMGKDMIKYAPS